MELHKKINKYMDKTYFFSCEVHFIDFFSGSFEISNWFLSGLLTAVHFVNAIDFCDFFVSCTWCEHGDVDLK